MVAEGVISYWLYLATREASEFNSGMIVDADHAVHMSLPGMTTISAHLHTDCCF